MCMGWSSAAELHVDAWNDQAEKRAASLPSERKIDADQFSEIRLYPPDLITAKHLEDDGMAAAFSAGQARSKFYEDQYRRSRE